ncbi:MAG: type II toxin-antitoxin system VapB family antitoxin [Pseudomonadota bacterium]|jgi:antitoxin VapB
MPISIKDPEADRLARELSEATGESLTRAIREALRERLTRVRAGRRGRRLVDELDDIALRCAGLPVMDERAPDEILGYDEHGLPR